MSGITNKAGLLKSRHLSRLIEKLHLTPAIWWSVGGTVIAGATGPVVALLIAARFDPEIQGYYYTFGSLLALSTFLELGFNACVTQFICHEYAHLGMEDGVLKTSSPNAASRLGSLFRFALAWYGVAALLMLIAIGIGGELFFINNQSSHGVAWRAPWWILCAASAVGLLIQPTNVLLEGCNQVAWTARSRVIQNGIRSATLIVGLLLGAQLYAVGSAVAVSVGVALAWSLIKWRRLFVQVFSLVGGQRISWTKEIFPLQWKVAVSWASGYFIFSMFNPLMFSFVGAKAAGQFGMSWTMLQAIGSISNSFVSTRSPRFGMLFAKRDYSALKSSWSIAARQSVLVNCVGGGCLIVGVAALQYWEPALAARVLGLGTLAILCFANSLNQFVSSVATLVRADKKEPFLWVSVLTAVSVFSLSVFWVGKYQAIGVSLAYLIGVLFSTACAYFILKEALSKFPSCG